MPTSTIDHGFSRLTFFMAFLVVITIVTQGPSAEGRENPVVKAIAAVRASVVNIRGEKEISNDISTQLTTDDPSRRVKGMGTGVIIDARGYIVTNFHVVDSVKEIQVTTYDSRSYIARIIARDKQTDLAIIKIDCETPLQTIPMGNSSELNIGETVIAVGNAYGYENTVTLGIVSALNRSVQASDVQFYENLIQTDASINPGNSGGPLLNIDGEMIGINVAVRAGAQGIGFAIPVDRALEVIADLLEQQSDSPAWHGLTLKVTTLWDGRRVVCVDGVEKNSPAAATGIHKGDILKTVDGVEVTNRADFVCALVEYSYGHHVKLEVLRDNEPYQFSIVYDGTESKEMANQRLIWTKMGVQVSVIPQAEFTQKYNSQYKGGMTVQRVRSDSPAEEQGIQPGDVLIGMHKWEMLSLDNIVYVLNHPDCANQKPVRFLIIRDHAVLYGNISFRAVENSGQVVSNR